MALRSFADGAVFAEVFGEGPPQALALHGWGRRGSDFSAVLDGLPALAPDLPGFGASPAPGRGMGARGYAGLLADVLSRFQSPPVVIGHSFGGRVAVSLAAEQPAEVAALVLSGVPLLRRSGSREPSLAYRGVRALSRRGLLPGSVLDHMRRSRGSADYLAASGVMRQVLVETVNESYEQELAAVECPVRLVWGAEDAEVPPRVAMEAVELIEEAGGSATLEVLAGVGHHVPLQAPEELRRAIQELL